MNPTRMLFAGVILVVLALFVLMFVLPLAGIVLLAPFAIGTLLTGMPILWIAVTLVIGVVILMGWVPFLKGPSKLVAGLAFIAVTILLYMGVL
jgi:hypothetical protein